MIRKLGISVQEYIRSWAVPHKRQPGLLAFLRALAAPFEAMMADWRSWCDTAITRAQVTGETVSLEWYLNEAFDPINRDIYILSNDDTGVLLGLQTVEPTVYISVGLSGSEPADYIAVPLEGESVGIGTASFGVFVPSAYSAQENDIAAIVNIYRLAGKSFVIIYF